MRTPLLATLSLLLIGCADPESPEAQVRKTVADMETAAEARDVGDLMDHIAADFRNGYGQGREDLRRYIQGYFIANQSVHLLTRIDSLEFPQTDEARVQITIGMAGREADAANAWNLAADVQAFEATLRKEDGEWKVLYASRTAGH